ncbi:hypothetical protein EBB07_05145 [Paenibacillaceae bacterium]|nr:hypothetical protein EBB07_05145 [Paenibacillaceae bacterium]
MEMHSSLKVVLSTMLILTMIFSIPAWHTAGVGVVHAADFSGAGAGTANDPYQVATADQLNEVRNNLTAHYIQTADIDLGAYQGANSWIPIGNYEDWFYGSFDGRQHKITNLVISQNNANPVGLFGFIYTGSSLSNVILENVSVTGVVSVGSLVGDSMGTIKNSSSTGQVQGSDQVGGLVGQLRGPLTNSYSRASVSGDYAGGLIGVVAYPTSLRVSYSYATGPVTGSQYEAGGLVGFDINGEYISSYYDKDTTTMDDTGYGIGKSTADMKNIDTYADWNFDRIWSISELENDGYPYLNVRPANISYVGNGNDGGDVPIDAKSYLSGDEVTVYSNINGLTKTGYIFDGWSTEQNGNGITYFEGDVFPINEDTMLYARWKYDGKSTPVSPPYIPYLVKSNNADLSRLVLNSEGTTLALSPVFAAETVRYTAETDAEQVEFQLAAADSKAVVKLLNKPVGNTIITPLKLGTQTIVFTVHAEDGTEKEYTITLIRRAVTEEPPQEAVCSFTDIQSHWAQADICKALKLGIVEDVSSTIFGPDRTITRIEFVTMLLRTLQIPVDAEETSLSFNDTAELPSRLQSVILTGVSEGILTGYTDGSFRPHHTISRIELATMLAKAMKWESSSAPNRPFADQENIPAWAQPHVGVVHARGILQGRSGNQFAPNGVTTNAEAAVTLLRLWNTLELE